MRVWLPVLLAACSLAAGAALLGCGGGTSGEAADASWAQLAERRCSAATYRLVRMPPIHFATYRKVVPMIAENERTLARWLGNLEAPEKSRRSIGRLIVLLELQARAVDKAVADDNGNIYSTVHRQDVSDIRRLSGQIAVAARATGASACAHAPVPVSHLGPSEG